jgi:uncharacterized protein YndB with AHSA1/START domain
MPAVAQESLNPAITTTHIHEIYIRADAAAIWNALTTPEWSARYGYRAIMEYELRAGGKFRARANAGMLAHGLPETIIDGEVIEAKPPYKLVQTFRFLFSDDQRREGFTRLTFEIVPTTSGFCRLTVTHDLTGAPLMAANTSSKYDQEGGGGWNWILSDLKSLLETGKNLAA